MDHTEERQRSFAYERAERTTFAFAAFVFAHAECEGEFVEFRLGEKAVACWCPRCGELRAFGPADESPLPDVPLGIPSGIRPRAGRQR